MRFLDNLGKSLSTGVERAKYEADKFQRTSKINSEISNFNAQVETNLRQLGERALELYQQGTLQAPEIASLAQIIGQLRDQVQGKQRELEQANAETFEQFQATQPQPAPQATGEGYSIPIGREPVEGSFPTPTSHESHALPQASSDISGTGMPNSASVGGVTPAGSTPYACSSCGFALPEGAAFCPECGTRTPGR